MEYNYVTMCLADVSILLPNRYIFDNCVSRRQLGSCSMTSPLPLSEKGVACNTSLHPHARKSGAESAYFDTPLLDHVVASHR